MSANHCPVLQSPTHLHNDVYHPLVGFGITKIYHGAVAVTSPDGAIGIPHYIASFDCLLVVVVCVWGPSLGDIAQHAVDVSQGLDVFGVEGGYEVCPVGIVSSVHLKKIEVFKMQLGRE